MSNSKFLPKHRPRLHPDVASEDRKALVKRELEAQRFEAETKTERLRALRLEKQAADNIKPALWKPVRLAGNTY